MPGGYEMKFCCVHCQECDARIGYPDTEMAAAKDAWNTRADKAAPDVNVTVIFNTIKECLKEIRPEMEICELLAMATTLSGALARAEAQKRGTEND